MPRNTTFFGIEKSSFRRRFSEKVDPRTGRTYISIQIKMGMDVRAFEVGPDRGAYLFTNQNKAKRLLVYAHGGSGEESNITVLKPGMPSVALIGPHNKVLLSNFLTTIEDIIRNDRLYAKISPSGIMLTSHQSEEDFQQNGYKIIAGTHITTAIRNYRLRKVNSNDAGCPDIHILSKIAMQVDRFKQQEGRVDILTVRNSGRELTTSDVFAIAQKEGYEEIIWHICRSDRRQGILLRQGRLPKQECYDFDDTKPLEIPIVSTWEELNPYETNKPNLFRSLQ